MLVLISIIVTILLNNLHQYAYTTYQQDTCMITNEQIDSYTSKNTTTYYPDLTYTVIGNGQQFASGNDGMGLASSDFQDGVQQELNQYQVGSSYPCWYSSIALPDAMLVQPDVAGSGSWEACVWLFGTFGVLFLLEVGIIFFFVFSWGLYKHTVQVIGTVVKHEQHQTKNGSYTVSLIEFQTQTEPPLRCRTKSRGAIPLDSSIDLCYDWRHPVRNNRKIMRYAKTPMITDMVIGVFLLLPLIALGTWLFTWLAFHF